MMNLLQNFFFLSPCFFCPGLLLMLVAALFTPGPRKQLVVLAVAAGMLLGAVLGYGAFEGLRSGQASWWQRLPDLPEPAVSIAGVMPNDFEHTLIFASARSGKIYVCCDKGVMRWVEATTSPRYTEILALPLVTPQACTQAYPTYGRFPLSNLPEPIFQCVYEPLSMEWVTDDVYYVLLHDGSLWRWRYYVGFDLIFECLLGGTLLGGLVGLLLALRWYWRRMPRRQTPFWAKRKEAAQNL